MHEMNKNDFRELKAKQQRKQNKTKTEQKQL